ncbi:hypothetical protein NQZ68_004121 [Dissostichus eleginoides]|nr:hypothetical protein NQZ68_004121 [Dissostichus eleginoides]
MLNIQFVCSLCGSTPLTAQCTPQGGGEEEDEEDYSIQLLAENEHVTAGQEVLQPERDICLQRYECWLILWD